MLQELAAEVALAASRIERKRVSEREAREAEAQGQVNRALDALLAEGSSEAARAEALRLLKATPGRMLMDKTREILAALDGPWSSIPPERAEARALLGRFLEENGGVFGFPVEPYLPRVPHRVSVRGESTVGRLKPSYGLGLYDFHREWPIDGMGVPKDQIDVVLSDGSRQPILDWLRGQRVRVICPRCGGFVDRTVEEGCPGVVVRTAPGRRVSPLGDG